MGLMSDGAKTDSTASCALPPDDAGIEAVAPVSGGERAMGAPLDMEQHKRRERAVFGLG